MWEPIDTPSVTQDDDDIHTVRRRLEAEEYGGVGSVELQTRYLFCAGPLQPVGVIAVGNMHEWAAYVAGLPTYSAPGPFWERVYRSGAKLPEDVARAWFPGFGGERPYRR